MFRYSRCLFSFSSSAALGSGTSWDPLVSLKLGHQTLVLLEKCTSTWQFKQILAQMIRNDLVNQTFPISRLLHYSAIRNPNAIDSAIILFNHFVHEPNLYIYNTMISALSSCELSFCLYKSMLESSVSPDKHTFCSLLKAVKCLSEGKQIHAHVILSGFFSDTYIQNSLMKLYLENGQNTIAYQVFERMPDKDTASWNVLISGYSNQGSSFKALELFYEMKRWGPDPDEFTMVSLLMALGKLSDLWLGKSVHTWITRRNLINASNLILENALLNFYVKCEQLESSCRFFYAMIEKNTISWNTILAGFAKSGDMEAAYGLFNKMPCKDLTSWNTLLDGFAEVGKLKAAMGLFTEMVYKNIRPNVVTIVVLVSAAALIGELSQGRWAHGWVTKTEMRDDVYVGSALIDMYSKCGSIKRALMVFERMQDRDVATWTAMILGFALHGYGKKALDMFSRMQETFTPNNVTILAVLAACSHSGMVEKGRRIFNGMKKTWGIEPGVEHYGCWIDLLTRAGRLQEARHVIESMPMRPSRQIWGSILNACKAYGDIALAETASRELHKLEPEKEGSFVLLANMLAEKGSWHYSDKIRETMENRGLKKTAGCSWLSVDGRVNEFLAGDKRHCRWTEIYSVLANLNKQMKPM